MPVDLLAAVVAGLVAAQPMEAPVYLQRAAGLGVHQDVFAEGGTLLRAPARVRRLVGWLGHGLLAAVIALLYAAFFDVVGAQDRLWLWGVLGGAIHAVVGGIVVGVFPTVEPSATPAGSHGVFYRHYGRLDVLTFLSGHLVFGALVGALYALFAA